MENDLTFLCRETFGGNAVISGLRRLTGGANAAIWSFDFDDKPLILRQDASEILTYSDKFELSSIGLKVEASLMKAAREYGIKAPKIYAVTPIDSPLGESVLMERVEGEALPQKLFSDLNYEKALSGLALECAGILAKIHAIQNTEIENKLDRRTPKKALSLLKNQFDEYGQSSAVLASALNWMEQNCPTPNKAALLHGDFRMGNLLIDENGVSSVLDWELAYIGDPVSDIAYFCAPPWRFGRYDDEAGGVGAIEDLVSAYEAATGNAIESERLIWWRMFASVNWCLMCMTMANMWRSETDRELERIVIGTRVSESEVDILLIFDEIFEFQDKVDFELPNIKSGDHKAHTIPGELAEAIIEWLGDDVIPAAKGRDGFKGRVARNATRILKRDIELRPFYTSRQQARLESLNTDQNTLINQLLNGSVTIASQAIRLHLKQTTIEQLSIDQPKYAGFTAAQHSWSKS